MPLTMQDLDAVKRLQDWFDPQGPHDGEDPSTFTSLGPLCDQLGELLFSPPDSKWYEREANVVLEALGPWVIGEDETQFRNLTGPGQAKFLLEWLEPALARWIQDEAQSTAEPQSNRGEYAKDPVKGSAWYKLVTDAAGLSNYLYTGDDPETAPVEDAVWESMDARITADPWAPPVWDAGHQAYYQFNRLDFAYRWQDPRDPTKWIGQGEFERLRAESTQAVPQAAAAQEPEAVWDDNWEMFYRLQDGVYEYSHAKDREKNKGPDGNWLTYEKAMAQTNAHPAPAPPAREVAERAAEAGAGPKEVINAGDAEELKDLIAELARDPDAAAYSTQEWVEMLEAAVPER